MNRILPVLAMIVVLLSAGCAPRRATAGQNGSGGATPETSPKMDTPRGSGWYYFSDEGIHAAGDPSEIPARKFLPWTEAVRVCDAAIVDGVPSFLINKLGLMTSPSNGDASALHKDSLFAKATADGIYRTETETAVRLYRNSFFGGGVEREDSTFLAGYNMSDGTFHPLLSARDIGLDPAAQCVALDRIGSMWYASFKLEKNGKVDFTYLEFESFPTPNGSAPDSRGIRKIGLDSYQKSVAPFSWNDAPDQLKAVLSSIPEKTAFNLKMYSRSTRSTQTYARHGEGTPVDATAYVSDDTTAVLFADGTFCWMADNSTGKIKSLKLPALSSGYVYTSFLISGKSLLAAWEEQRFFETGRAGILVTALPDGL